MSAAIDLSLLPPPDVVEALDYETIYGKLLARFQQLYPQHTALHESDPVVKLLELIAYLELQLRAHINDATRAVMLASATGGDLDQLAALYGVQRLVTDPGNPAARPPVPPSYETDANLRARTQLALEGFSTAGPAGAYRFHALSASGEVKDVGIDSPAPGQVRVTVLARSGDGTPAAPLLATVLNALNHDDVRPLTDLVSVVPASVLPYQVAATLTLYPGPSSAPVLQQANEAVRAYAANVHRLGFDVTLSGLYAALHQPGVQRVTLARPLADVVCGPTQAPYCTAIALSVALETNQ